MTNLSINITRRALRASLAAMVVSLAALAAVSPASPFGAPAAQAREMKRFLRIGLNKSVVVRLPRGASDIIIGDPKIADAVIRSKRMVYLFARKMGQTNVYFLDRGGNPILTLDIEVSKDPAALQKLINRVLPHSRIKVEMVEDQILLSGMAKTAAEADTAMKLASRFVVDKKVTMGAGGASVTDAQRGGKVINAMTIAGKDQVMIKVRIAEVQRSVAKQLGINTQLAAQKLGSAALSGGATMLFPFSLGNQIGTSAFNLKYAGKNVTSNSVLQAMERDGLMRLLAEPTLTAISGESAKFLAGGEIPVVAGCTNGDNGVTCSYEMKEFGVALGFTPLVLTEGRISLKINTTVSEISSKYSLVTVGGNTVPGFEKRHAETTVEMPSGGTLALGGLIKDVTKQNINGIPGLKNLPVLGALFRSRDYQSSQTELVIMVTPYIVNPVNEKKLRTPLDKLNIASDAQTIFLGRLHRTYGAPSGPKGSGLVYHGNVGFIVE